MYAQVDSFLHVFLSLGHAACVEARACSSGGPENDTVGVVQSVDFLSFSLGRLDVFLNLFPVGSLFSSTHATHHSLPFAAMQGDAVVTDVEGVRAAVERCGAENVLCVVTTTSCFAPRVPDKVWYGTGYSVLSELLEREMESAFVTQAVITHGKIVKRVKL